MPTLRDFLNDKEKFYLLKEAIVNRLKSYHSFFDQPLTGTYWEEVLSKSFGDVGVGTTWTPTNSHKVGEDMKVVGMNEARISCKSGVIVNNRTHNLGNCVEYSSSRTSRYESIQEKIVYLDENRYDYHFLLSKKKKFDRRYELFILCKDMCKLGDLTWDFTQPNNPNIDGPFKAIIMGKTMSSQLWVTMPVGRMSFHEAIDLKM